MARLPESILCPSCAEPMEPGDRFCGVCGTDLTAPPPVPDTSGHAPEGEPAGGGTGAPAADVNGTGRDSDPDSDPDLDSDLDSGPDFASSDDSFELAPPRDPAAAVPAPAGGDTLPLGVPVPAPAPGLVVTDPREEPLAALASPQGPACVACGVGGVDSDGYCEHCGHAQPRPRDHQERELEGVAAVSDRGLRHHRNEDAFAVAATSLPDGTPAVVAVVCDGVSSASRPDDASAAAAATGSESLLDALEHGTSPERAMHQALLAAADAVSALAGQDGGILAPHHNAPACTCVSAVAMGKIFTVGWVGDSRAYWVPDDRSKPAARLTEDDSWAARMVSAGLMSEAEAYADERAHAITGWLGADAVEVDPHTASFQPEGAGVVVVCTDGLWNYAESADDLASVVPADARLRPLHCAQTLVGVALDGGGHDNVTVAVLPFPAAVERAATGPA